MAKQCGHCRSHVCKYINIYRQTWRACVKMWRQSNYGMAWLHIQLARLSLTDDIAAIDFEANSAQSIRNTIRISQ